MNDHDIVEKYEMKGVTKFIHANGMETTLKTVPTCNVDKQKAVLFISSSVGCRQGCKFCYITNKKLPYSEISQQTVISACMVVLDDVDISNKYLKLSFMGMGELFDTDLNVYDISRKLFEYALGNKMCLGIDRVDIGTSVPKRYNISHFENIDRLNDYLARLYIQGVAFNPHNRYDTNPVRIFMSLHSVDNEVRSELMPMSRPMSELIAFAHHFTGSSVIMHHMLLDGYNDSFDDFICLKNFMGMLDTCCVNSELRLLRFNKCAGCELNESPHVDGFIAFFETQGDIKFKYQISAGAEIKASCGQFICKDFK